MVMGVKNHLNAISESIQSWTGTKNLLTIDEMLYELSYLTGYDISSTESTTLEKKLAVMADIIRYKTMKTKNLSLKDMAVEIQNFFKGDENSIVRIKKKFYSSISDAIYEANDGDTVTLLRDITLENVTYTFFINKAITIDGKKADGSGNYKITADITTDYMRNLFQANADFTMQNVDVTLTSKAKSSVINGGANITVKNCNFDTQYRAVTFFRASTDKTLSVFNSNITGGNCVLYLYQCSGNVKIVGDAEIVGDVEIVDNPLIKCRGDVSDDGTSAVYVSGCTNAVEITESTIESENIGVQINKGSCNLYLGEDSRIETTTSHAIYAGGVGVGIHVRLAKNAYVESSKATDPYFTVNTSNYSIEFAEEYERYAMCSGASHSNGSGGFALEFFDSYQDAINSYFGTLFTYRADAADEFAANGHTVYETKDDYGVTYYSIVI